MDEPKIAERVEDGDSFARAQVKALEARVAELERQSADDLARWVPYAALAFAIVALSLALAR